MGLPNNVPNFQVGSRHLNGSDVQKFSDLIGTSAIGLIAQADGTRANATKINAANNIFVTVAGPNDSCILPIAYPGLEIFIANFGTNVLQVFARGLDTIDQTAGAIGVTIATNNVHSFRCLGVSDGAGIWIKFVGTSAVAPSEFISVE